MGVYRAQVWAKTHGVCWYCGTSMNPFTDFTEEHQDPKKQGGGDELENLVPACTRCNSRKWARTVEEYREYLAGKGELRFWGELQTEDEEEVIEIEPDPSVYVRMIKACFYIAKIIGQPDFGPVALNFATDVATWGNHSDSDWYWGYGIFSMRLWQERTGCARLSILQQVFYLQQNGIVSFDINESNRYGHSYTFDTSYLWLLYETFRKQQTQNLKSLTSKENLSIALQVANCKKGDRA